MSPDQTKNPKKWNNDLYALVLKVKQACNNKTKLENNIKNGMNTFYFI